jgi:hypothetical protein
LLASFPFACKAVDRLELQAFVDSMHIVSLLFPPHGTMGNWPHACITSSMARGVRQ